MSIILLAALIFFTVIACLRLDLAVFWLLVLLPAYLIRFQILGIPTTFLEAMILLAFAAWLFKTTRGRFLVWFKKRSRRQPYPFGPEIILIIVAGFLGAAATDFSFPAMGIFKAYFFEPVLLFILLLNVFPGAEGRRKIISALLLGAASTALLAIFQQATGSFIFNQFWAAAETRRVVAWFGYPNAVGLFLAPLIMVLVGYLFSLWTPKQIENKKSQDTEKEKNESALKTGWAKNINLSNLLIKSALIISTIIISLLAIYFAKSEGALVGLATGGFFFLLFAGKSWRILALSLLTIIAALIFFNPALKSYVGDKLALRDLSGEIRKQQWRETKQSFQGKKIIFGHGLSGYPAAIAPIHQEGIFFNRDKLENFHSILYGSAELRAKYWQPVEIYLYPHNIFLNFWSELGLLGLAVFIWIIGKYLFLSLKIFLRQRDYLALGLFGAMMVIVIHGLVDVPYFKNDLAAQFFILLALLASLLISHEKSFAKNNRR